ncbi:hypothetical protein PI125_g7230 [Phytophthora idaei]|nr:hypothetical protein PI125_g7230 [Phytophthora idaei]
MEAPRRQNRYTVKQRREALERVAVEGWGPDKQNYKGPGREKQDHIWTRLGHLHEGRTSRGRVFVYWRHDRVHEDGAGGLARDVFSGQVIS